MQEELDPIELMEAHVKDMEESLKNEEGMKERRYKSHQANNCTPECRGGGMGLPDDCHWYYNDPDFQQLTGKIWGMQAILGIYRRDMERIKYFFMD